MKMKKPLTPTCSICSCELESEGIGLLLRGQLICRTCEDRLVELKVTDQEYPWYLQKIKQILIS